MSAQPERNTDEVGYPEPVSEDTQNFERLLQRAYGWAIGHTVLGSFEIAERNFNNVLLNIERSSLNRRTLTTTRVLHSRSIMYENRGWYWYAYRDLQAITAMAESGVGVEQSVIDSVAERSEHLEVTLEILSKDWPLRDDFGEFPYGHYPPPKVIPERDLPA